MVWAEVSLDSRADLYVFARGGITEAIHRSAIPETITRPRAGAIGDALILMQYNARAHTVQVYMHVLDD